MAVFRLMTFPSSSSCGSRILPLSPRACQYSTIDWPSENINQANRHIALPAPGA